MSTPGLIPGPLSDAQIRELVNANVSGVLPLNAFSAALEVQHTIKASAGKLYGVSVLNTNAAARFILLFDAKGTVANGAIPVAVFTAAAGPANLGLYFGSVGRAFEQGIVIANSTTSSTLTLGSADSWFDAQFV